MDDSKRLDFLIAKRFRIESLCFSPVKTVFYVVDVYGTVITEGETSRKAIDNALSKLQQP